MPLHKIIIRSCVAVFPSWDYDQCSLERVIPQIKEIKYAMFVCLFGCGWDHHQVSTGTVEGFCVLEMSITDTVEPR